MEPSLSTEPQGQPAQVGAPAPPKARPVWIAFSLLYVIAVLTVPLEFMLWTLVDGWIPPVGMMIGMFVGAAAFLVQIRQRVVRQGRGGLRMNVWELVGRMAVGAAPAVLVVSGLYALNCAADPSPSAPRRVQVTGMSISLGKSKSHNLELQSWRSGETALTVRVDEETWNTVKGMPVEQRAVMIDARSGRLGLAWYGSIKPATH